MTSPQTESRKSKIKHLRQVIDLSLILLAERSLGDLNTIDGRRVKKIVVELAEMVETTKSA